VTFSLRSFLNSLSGLLNILAEPVGRLTAGANDRQKSGNEQKENGIFEQMAHRTVLVAISRSIYGAIFSLNH
jgi:hypothetical protein